MKKITITLLALFLSSISFSQTSDDFFKSAKAKQEAKDYQGAIDDYKKGFALTPKPTSENTALYETLYTDSGFCKENNDDFKGALADYNKILEFLPESAAAKIHILIAKIGLQDYDGVMKECTSRIAKDATDYKAFYYRGFCNVQIAENAKGCADLNKAKELFATSQIIDADFLKELTAQIANNCFEH